MMRFPEGMRDELKAKAQTNGRALNAEIIARLEAYDKFETIAQELNKSSQ